MIITLVYLLIFSTLVMSTNLKEWHTPTKRITITGGDEAVPHAYPYQVGLKIGRDQFCGGSLISRNYVLTAAHCAIEISSTVDIILGAHNISKKENTQIHRTFSKIIIHNDFNDITFQNDLALIELYKPVPLTAAIQTIPLVSKIYADSTYAGEIGTSTGWGLMEDVLNPSIKDMSSVLRVVNVAVIDLDQCKDYYKDDDFNITYITENNICTNGDNKKGTCRGDSGGPLVLDGMLIGIVSSGTDLCQIGAPSVFTHIGKYLDWIEEWSDVVLRH